MEYYVTMIRMCNRYTSDQEVAVDIVNNGFLKVFKKIESHSGSGSFEGWIRRCIYHCLCDYFRKDNKRIKFLEMQDYEHPRTDNDGLPDLMYDDLMVMVDQLPEVSRKVFVLFCLEGYSHKEVAAMVDISVGTSKWHVSNARRLLKLRIDKVQSPQETGHIYEG